MSGLPPFQGMPSLGGPPSPTTPAQPGGGLGGLPPLNGFGGAGAPPVSAPQPMQPFGAAPSMPNMAPAGAPSIGPLPALNVPAAPSAGALGPLPPLNAAPRPVSGGGGAMPFAPPPTSGDPFASSDPFSNSGDPFAQPGGAANTPSGGMNPLGPAATAHAGFHPQGGHDPFPPADPFASSQVPSAPRPATIGPGGAIPPLGYPPMKSGVAPIFPRAQSGNAWGGNRVEPEVEESRTRVGPAVNVGRPKFLVTQLDGTEEGELALNEGENVIGREMGGMFSKDNLLSSRHATLIVQGQNVWVRDDGSRNGVYMRIPRQQHVELTDGDQFCIGRVILRFEFAPTADSLGLLHLVVGRDVDKGMFPYRIPRSGLSLGRNRAELKFPLDGWVSGMHCQVLSHGPQVMLVDLGSSNGTYLRLRTVQALAHLDALLMGQRIFHLHIT